MLSSCQARIQTLQLLGAVHDFTRAAWGSVLPCVCSPVGVAALELGRQVCGLRRQSIAASHTAGHAESSAGSKH